MRGRNQRTYLIRGTSGDNPSGMPADVPSINFLPARMSEADELDIENPDALREYLRSAGHVSADEDLRIRILPGGVSNRTVFVGKPSGEAWVLKQPLAKLRVAVDWFSPVERIHREALGLRYLSRFAPAGSIPRFVFEDLQHHILAMEAVPEPHENWKDLLLSGQLRTSHVEQFARLLAAIHVPACKQQADVADVFEDRSFFESLRLEPYYGYTAQQVPAAAFFLKTLIQVTRSRRITLVHGDYSPKNILVREGRLILLDHEVIHFGDPAFDLGFSLSHLLSKAHHLAGLRADFADAARQYWGTYAEAVTDQAWSHGIERHAVQHTMACLLARVAGKSTLKYLDEEARQRQQAALLPLISNSPETMPELIARFMGGL